MLNSEDLKRIETEVYKQKISEQKTFIDIKDILGLIETVEDSRESAEAWKVMTEAVVKVVSDLSRENKELRGKVEQYKADAEEFESAWMSAKRELAELKAQAAEFRKTIIEKVKDLKGIFSKMNYNGHAWMPLDEIDDYLAKGEGGKELQQEIDHLNSQNRKMREALMCLPNVGGVVVTQQLCKICSQNTYCSECLFDIALREVVG